MHPLERVRALAPTLSEAELRVLLELAPLFGNDGEIKISLDGLAQKVKIARSAALRATRSLNGRGLLVKRRGYGGAKNRYLLRLDEVVPPEPTPLEDLTPAGGAQ